MLTLKGIDNSCKLSINISNENIICERAQTWNEHFETFEKLECKDLNVQQNSYYPKAYTDTQKMLQLYGFLNCWSFL